MTRCVIVRVCVVYILNPMYEERKNREGKRDGEEPALSLVDI